MPVLSTKALLLGHESYSKADFAHTLPLFHNVGRILTYWHWNILLLVIHVLYNVYYWKFFSYTCHF